MQTHSQDKIENLARSISNGGLVAGTQVWTDQGLKPIEAIEVGDMVLSKPENGDGGQQYKRVVKTFVHEAKEILELRVKVGEKTKVIYPTANHPFWVVEEKEEWRELANGELVSSSTFTEIGWLPADELIRYKHHVQLSDGSLAMVSAILPVYCTKEQGVGFIPLLQDPNRHDYGNLTDFNRGRKFIPGEYDPTEDDWDDDDPYLKVRVYNFEVEDFHTYFVDCGVWVHM
ncbi:hypothetical protein HZU75_15590 [Chitinibacter fontanus]|uniref:Hint domain-containing protein n=1 Tax=Chitinibacter fontanus TaxID=1737446 RepID=A0A7D5VC06_9NEIS|nr:polymorphic toxin-type HINT domain-containing protein [Chitinibacter fontanus]QLI82832.1 hypothetical protein HZU75_15590 [Chitinibacter fontanus]